MSESTSAYFDAIDFRQHAGWLAGHTTHEAAGAMRNGTRVVKVASEKGDANPDGTLGTVLGSMSHPEVYGGAMFYFVEWDTSPRLPVGCMGYKLERVP